MIYMTPQAINKNNRILYNTRRWGLIKHPDAWVWDIPVGYRWCLDNGAFKGFHCGNFMSAMEKLTAYKTTCLFVVSPDSLGNAVETLDMFRHWIRIIKNRGFPVAFVAQDGQESLTLPPEFDCLFIGGTTEWKLSKYADKLIRAAKGRGAWVHVGRVNSKKRIAHFQLLGVDSVDGTNPVFAPNKNVPKLDSQLRQPPLMEM